jgi:hypothetical protein
VRFFTLALLIALASCGKRETVLIDGSSPETFEKSLRKARQTIPNADKLVFDRAIRTVRGRRYSADPDELARTTFNGMTAAEVVADQKAREK